MSYHYTIIFPLNIYTVCVCAKSLQTLCSPMDYSPSGSSVHGILQARILEWVALPSSRGSSWLKIEPTSPSIPALQADSLPLSHGGSPNIHSTVCQLCVNDISWNQKKKLLWKKLKVQKSIHQRGQTTVFFFRIILLNHKCTPAL